MTTDSNLVPMPDTSLTDLNQVSSEMQAYIRASSNETRQLALDAMARRGLLTRLFPTQLERERQRIAVDSMRATAESKREFLDLFTRTQLEIARKRADALIAAQGVHVHAQLARFANEKIHDLTETVNRSLVKFLEEMDPQFTTIERFKHRPELYDPAYKSVLHLIDTYFESTRTLLDGFIQSLKNRVSEVQR